MPNHNPKNQQCTSLSGSTPSASASTPNFSSNSAFSLQTTASSPPQPYKHIPSDYATIPTTTLKTYQASLVAAPAYSLYQSQMLVAVAVESQVYLNAIKHRFTSSVTCPYCQKPPVCPDLQTPAPNPGEQSFVSDFVREREHVIPPGLTLAWDLIWIEFSLFDNLKGLGSVDVEEWMNRMEGLMQEWEVGFWEEVLMVGERGKCVLEVGIGEEDLLHGLLGQMGE